MIHLMQIFSHFPNHRTLSRVKIGVFLIVVLLAEASGFSGLPLAHAAGPGANFSLQPVVSDPANPATKSYFIFNGRPGATLQNSVRVTNVGSASGTVALYAVDATTSQRSSITYLGRNDPRQDVGAWVALTSQQLTLNPGQSQAIPFNLTIPNNVRSCQHVGGIVAENVTPSGTSNPGINVNIRTIIPIVVNLPGTPIEQLVATGVQPDKSNPYQKLLLGLSNTGTVMVSASGSLQLTDVQGKLIQNTPLNLDVILPQTSIQYPLFILKKALPIGNYNAKLQMTYGKQQQVLTYTTTFTIQTAKPPIAGAKTGEQGNIFSVYSPWSYILCVAILLLSIGGIFFWLQKKRSNKLQRRS